MSDSLTNSKELIAQSTSVINKSKVIVLKALFLSNIDAIHNIVGLPVATLDFLQQLAEAIHSNASFFNNIMAAVGLKSNVTYVIIVCDSIIKQVLNHGTLRKSHIILEFEIRYLIC